MSDGVHMQMNQQGGGTGGHEGASKKVRSASLGVEGASEWVHDQ